MQQGAVQGEQEAGGLHLLPLPRDEHDVGGQGGDGRGHCDVVFLMLQVVAHAQAIRDWLTSNSTNERESKQLRKGKVEIL